MLQLPKIKLINNSDAIDTFESAYTRCSGFTVNRDYYETNRVFGIYCQEKMIGGFVLGSGKSLRTLDVFVGDTSRANMYQAVQSEAFSEICCFWIEPSYCKKFWKNLFVWLNMAYIIYAWSTPNLIFGTNSVRLAALYGATTKSKALHQDYLNRKKTFVFTGKRRDCFVAFGQIIWYKMKRSANTYFQRRKAKMKLAFSL